MNTTNVFVELLVIGLGPLAAIALLFVAFEPAALASFMDVASASPLVAMEVSSPRAARRRRAVGRGAASKGWTDRCGPPGRCGRGVPSLPSPKLLR